MQVMGVHVCTGVYTSIQMTVYTNKSTTCTKQWKTFHMQYGIPVYLRHYFMNIYLYIET